MESVLTALRSEIDLLLDQRVQVAAQISALSACAFDEEAGDERRRIVAIDRRLRELRLRLLTAHPRNGTAK